MDPYVYSSIFILQFKLNGCKAKINTSMQHCTIEGLVGRIRVLNLQPQVQGFIVEYSGRRLLGVRFQVPG